MNEMGWTTIAYLNGAGKLYSVDIPGTRSASETERLQEYFQNNPKGAQELLKKLKRGHPEMQSPVSVQAGAQSMQAQSPHQVQSPPQAQVSTTTSIQTPVCGSTNREDWDDMRWHVEAGDSLRVEEVLFIRDNGWDPLLDSPEVTSVLRPMKIPTYITKRGFSVVSLATLKKRQDWENAQRARDAASTSNVGCKTTVGRPSSPTSLCNLPMPSFMYKHDDEAKSVYPFGAVGDGRPSVGISMAALRRVDSAMSTSPRESIAPLPGLGHIEPISSSRTAVASSVMSSIP